MTVAFDANVLLFVLNPKAASPKDSRTGLPVVRCADRVNHLLKQLQARKQRVVIPTPAFAEVLVRAEAAAPEYLSAFQKSRYFALADFDARAAVEHAVIQRRRQNDPGVPKTRSRAQAKFDDQIVAIAAVAGVTTIYSDDDGVQKLAQYLGIEAKGVVDLPLPPEDPQQELDLLMREQEEELASPVDDGDE